MSDQEFIPGDKLTDADVEAYERGELVAWRKGPDGTQWYRRITNPEAETDHPDIIAVPSDTDTLMGRLRRLCPWRANHADE